MAPTPYGAERSFRLSATPQSLFFAIKWRLRRRPASGSSQPRRLPSEGKAMTITVDARLRPAVQARYFHVLMAACCVAIAFLGFAPTYWLPLAAGTFKA